MSEYRYMVDEAKRIVSNFQVQLGTHTYPPPLIRAQWEALSRDFAAFYLLRDLVPQLTDELEKLRAERDAALAEAAKANAANSLVDLIKATIAGNRFANEVQAIENERDAAVAERDAALAENELLRRVCDAAKAKAQDAADAAYTTAYATYTTAKSAADHALAAAYDESDKAHAKAAAAYEAVRAALVSLPPRDEKGEGT